MKLTIQWDNWDIYDLWDSDFLPCPISPRCLRCPFMANGMDCMQQPFFTFFKYIFKITELLKIKVEL